MSLYILNNEYPECLKIELKSLLLIITRKTRDERKTLKQETSLAEHRHKMRSRRWFTKAFQTDRQPDRRTDRASYRDGRTHLKRRCRPYSLSEK